MADINNLKDYKLALQMVKEIPEAVKILEDSRSALAKYHGFTAVAKTLSIIENSILNLETSLPYFQSVVKDKGGQFE